MSPVRLLARPLLASYFVANGVRGLRDPDAEAARSAPVTSKLLPLVRRVAPQVPDDPRTVARIMSGVQVAAGLALATGRMPRVAALALAGSLAPAALTEVPQARGGAGREALLKDLGLVGGLLIAGMDTKGKPGLPWRAQRAAKDAKRMARTAKREAKLAARAAKAEVKYSTHELLH